MTGCGRDTCGVEGPGGMRMCSARHGAPTQTAAGSRWNHFRSDEHVVKFAALWDEMQRKTSPTTVVREGFRPSRRDCFCDGGQCFYGQAAKWKVYLENKAKAKTCQVLSYDQER